MRQAEWLKEAGVETQAALYKIDSAREHLFQVRKALQAAGRGAALVFLNEEIMALWKVRGRLVTIGESLPGMVEVSGPGTAPLAVGECPNCGGRYDIGYIQRCEECGLTHATANEIDLSKPLCSVCRRRHGSEVRHECE